MDPEAGTFGSSKEGIYIYAGLARLPLVRVSPSATIIILLCTPRLMHWDIF